MSAENKALVLRFYTAIDEGDIGALDDLVAENYIDHSRPPFPDLPPGRAGLKRPSQFSRKPRRATTS